MTHVAKTVQISLTVMGKSFCPMCIRLSYYWRCNMWRERRWCPTTVSPFLQHRLSPGTHTMVLSGLGLNKYSWDRVEEGWT